MRAGDVFRFIGIADIHVWMILSDPVCDPKKLLIVNFTTWEPHLDQACIVDVGDHPFIVHKSVVNFGRARIVSDATLEQLQSAGRLERLAESLSPQLLKRIQHSALESLTLSLDAADILIDQELVD